MVSFPMAFTPTPQAIPTCTILKKEHPHKAYSACLNKQRLSL